MANIRARMEMAEEALCEIYQGRISPSDLEGLLNEVDHQLLIVQTILQKGGDDEAPICCFQTDPDGKIGCGRYVDGEYQLDILAPLDEFVEYCLKCRKERSDELPNAQGSAKRARILHCLPLEEILDDLEKLHFAQQAMEHLHVPLIFDEDLMTQAQLILPRAKSLPYFQGKFSLDFREAYFGKGEGSSTHVGFGVVRISQSAKGECAAYSHLAHEICHVLAGIGTGNETIITTLGLETNAALALAGDKNHEISLYQILKNLAAYTGYVKARWTGQRDLWAELVYSLFPEDVAKKIEETYQKSMETEFAPDYFVFGAPDYHYLLIPYLSFKEVLREGRNYIAKDDVFDRDTAIPRLAQILRRELA